ncbi:uncharacterized protein N7483_009830 [Penicillium malachiteum]|uniref:uncharacterized protein n=1 Tax=Penicillium malachiteum TaxID=1324776 RepID=UPI002546F59B|nr:uncharacterized protein N7483_009830 [Penicillium malachiteum]KAJ5721896.1 hypothetical protein N7483_009830 [Penicillium malachiteum]
MVFGKMDPDIIFDIMLRKPAAFNIQVPSLSSMAQHFSTKQMELVLQDFPNIFVTESVLAGAARNRSHPEMLGFLWPRREQAMSITEDILVGAASDSSPINLKFIISELEPNTRLNDCVMEQVIGKSAVSMIKMLWESQKITFEISAKMIEIAISRYNDPLEMLEILALFDNNIKPEVPVTESLVSVAAGHPKCLDIPLSDQVFIAACSNPPVQSRILDKSSGSVPVDQMVAKFVSRKYPTEVLDMLFDRKLLDVDEKLLETMAGRYETLTAVLSRAPDMPITDQVLLKAARDSRSICLLLYKRSIDKLIAENIIIAATESCDSDQFQRVVESIINHIGPAPLTERVFLAVVENIYLKGVFPWLCDQPQSSDDPFTEDILIAATKYCNSTEFEQIFEAMINNMGFAPITEKVFLAVLSSYLLWDTIPWLCEKRRNIHDHSIEDIFIAAVNSNDSTHFQDIVKNFIDYMGLDLITDKVFRATIYNCLPDAFQWLCDQRQDLNLTWEGTCRTILQDMNISAESKLIPLGCLELPIDVNSLKISPTLLAKYPYDLEHGNNYGLDDLVNSQ